MTRPIHFSMLLFLLCHPLLQAQIDTSLFSGLKARSIGPAGMGGRISEVAAVEANPSIIYVAAATGGVWKSTNAGSTWKSLFDNQPVASIGAVAVFQPVPSIVWAGTGEGNPRNSASVGNGIYKSMDGGESWMHVGLEKTEKIHRVVLHPSDQQVAYVAALGATYGESTERGVFKTTDGGKSWNKILFVNSRTGCADLVMDPSNPNKLFAAMWEHRRWPWFFTSGGTGSGLYVTYDAGEHWTKCTDPDGLPKGDLGRIGVAISRSRPAVVYALIEAKKSAICRSDDGGRSWRIVNAMNEATPRPFYFADIRVDPQNENRIYNLHYNVTVSEDGGRSFQTISWSIHSDHHALWIHPGNPDLILDGNDGGVAISHDRGRSWRFVDNLPLAQFYHINVDMQHPFNIYGGMQDNGSWRGPSDVWEWGGIRNFHWQSVGWGDGFGVLSDPSDSSAGYSMSQGGHLMRFNLTTGERKNIRPDGPDGLELRFNWNAAIALDPFESTTIYYGSQFLHRSTNRGDAWQIISPDLTTNDTTKQKQHESGGLTPDVTDAENYETIITIAPSPVRKGVIWVGTDDGRVQLTTDGGTTWSNTAQAIPSLPANTYCAHIEASKFAAGSAYVVFDDHRRGNWKTYLFKTDDYGITWKSLTGNDPTAGRKNEQWGYALVIEQDPVKPDLLYLGTEFGLFISMDDGKNWMKWLRGYPTVSTMALAVHPREHDLVIGTHGRSAYILDDVRPFRTLSKEVLNKPIHLFDVPPAYQHASKPTAGYGGIGDAMFRGETRPYGSLITFSINPPKDSITLQGSNGTVGKGGETEGKPAVSQRKKVTMEVLDASGRVIRKTDIPFEKGLNRFSWNFRCDGFRQPRYDRPVEDTIRPEGPQVVPGKYTIRLTLGKESASREVEVRPDPRREIPMEDRRTKFDLQMKVGAKLERCAEAIDRVTRVRKSIAIAMEQLRDSGSIEVKNVRVLADSVKKKIDVIAARIMAPPDLKGIQRDDRRLVEKYGYVAGSLGSSWDAPTPAQMAYLRQADASAAVVFGEFNALFGSEVRSLGRMLDGLKLHLLPEYGVLTVDME